MGRHILNGVMVVVVICGAWGRPGDVTCKLKDTRQSFLPSHEKYFLVLLPAMPALGRLELAHGGWRLQRPRTSRIGPDGVASQSSTTGRQQVVQHALDQGSLLNQRQGPSPAHTAGLSAPRKKAGSFDQPSVRRGYQREHSTSTSTSTTTPTTRYANSRASGSSRISRHTRSKTPSSRLRRLF